MREFEQENVSPHGAEDKKPMSLWERLATKRKAVEERAAQNAAEQTAAAQSVAPQQEATQGTVAYEDGEEALESADERLSQRENHLTLTQLDLLAQMRTIVDADQETERVRLEAETAALAAGEEPPAPIVRDGRLLVAVESDELTVWGLLLPPQNGGAMPTRELLKDRLKAEGICNGIVNLDALLDPPQWKELLVLAQGQPAVNGENGTVKDLFQREVQFHLEESDQQIVDFKQLNWLQQVHKGQTICELTIATRATPGKDVRGRVLQGQDGVVPAVPQGTNTEVNGDLTALVATCDGQLTYRKGAFHVEQVLQLPGDVDNSSGNLDVIGNVVIGGNISSGFSVKATGDIIVKGQVEGAYLTAGGNIIISQGVKGAFKGMLEAKGRVQAKFMENAQVHAGGVVIAESIVNSQVFSGDRVTANVGKGVIIGGRVSARNVIEAKSIGNESNRLTALVVGADPSVLETIRVLSKEVKELAASIDGMEKNMSYLSKQPKLTPEYQKLAGQLKLKLSVEKMRFGQKEKQLNLLKEQLDDKGCQVLATTVFAGTTVEIGNQKLAVQRPEKMCRIYKDNGEIWVGTR